MVLSFYSFLFQDLPVFHCRKADGWFEIVTRLAENRELRPFSHLYSTWSRTGELYIVTCRNVKRNSGSETSKQLYSQLTSNRLQYDRLGQEATADQRILVRVLKQRVDHPDQLRYDARQLPYRLQVELQPRRHDAHHPLRPPPRLPYRLERHDERVAARPARDAVVLDERHEPGAGLATGADDDAVGELGEAWPVVDASRAVAVVAELVAQKLVAVARGGVEVQAAERCLDRCALLDDVDSSE